MKKILSVIMIIALTAAMFTGCKSKGDESTAEFDSSQDITVVSREDGSGTRGAFIELFGIEVKGDDGTKSDKTTKEAIIASKTDIMLTNIASNEYAVGYVSLGSLNDTIKPLNIDGVEATSDNVKNGSYKIARPFMIATKGEATGLKKDFIDFILSAEGQEVVSNGYIKVNDNAAPYSGGKPSGKLVIVGSSSVAPVMEKLKEAYLKINTSAKIQVQQLDSTAGMTGAIDGTCDIGMASRELKDSEKEKLTATAIANDGIAVITNTKNPLTNIKSEQVKDIFTGKTTSWDQVSK